MALQLNWIIFFHLFIILLRSAEGVTQMNLTAGKAFQKRPFNLTCEVFGGSVSGALEYTRPLGGVVVQCDNSFDISNCDIQIPGYSVIASTSNTYTLNVASFSPKNDEGIWTCTDSAADTVTGKLNVTSSAVYSVVTNELPWIKNNSQSLDVSVVGVCTYQAAQCTWTYTVSGESEEPVPTELIKDHTDAAPCSSEDVQTTCSLQFSTVPDNFSRKLLRINVSVSHISLDGPLVPEGSPFIYFPESTTVGTTPSSTLSTSPSSSVSSNSPTAGSTTASTGSATTSTSTKTPSVSTSAASQDNGLTNTFIAVGACAGILVCGITAAVCFCCKSKVCCFRKSVDKKKTSRDGSAVNETTRPGSDVSYTSGFADTGPNYDNPSPAVLQTTGLPGANTSRVTQNFSHNPLADNQPPVRGSYKSEDNKYVFYSGSRNVDTNDVNGPGNNRFGGSDYYNQSKKDSRPVDRNIQMSRLERSHNTRI